MVAFAHVIMGACRVTRVTKNSSNSFGQQEFLRFLWALADDAARNQVPVPLPALPVLGPPPADSGDESSPLVREFRRVRRAFYLKARMEILLAFYEGISEFIVGRTHALQIKDISAFWRPELGGNADPDVQGNLGNAPDTAPIGQMGYLREGCPLHS